MRSLSYCAIAEQAEALSRSSDFRGVSNLLADIVANEPLPVSVDKSFLNEEQKEERKCFLRLHLAYTESLWRQGTVVEAMRHAEALVPHIEALDLPIIAARCYNILASLYMHFRMYDYALQYYGKALKIAEQLEQPRMISIVKGNIGTIYLHQENLESALEFYKSAYELVEGSDPLAEAQHLYNIANIYQKIKLHEKSETFILRALELAEKANNPLFVSHILRGRGSRFSQSERYDEALASLEQALAIDEQIGNQDGIAECHVNMASVLLSCNRYEESLAHLEKATFIYETMENGKALASGLLLKSQILAVPGTSLFAPEKAQQIYEKALSIVRQYESLSLEYDLMMTRSQMHKTLGQWEECANTWEKIHELFKKLQQEELRKSAEHFSFLLETAVLKKEKEVIAQKADELSQTNKIIYQQKQELQIQNEIIEKQKSQLEKTLTELQSLVSFKEMLMATIVHDLKTPLNAILNYTKESRSSPDVIENIEIAGVKMLQMVMNILDIQKLESSSLAIGMTVITGDHFLTPAFQQVISFIEGKDISLHITKQALETVCLGDIDLCERIATNLLSNAIKYVDSKGTIIVDVKENTPDQPNMTIFMVHNSGSYIPPQQRESIFMPYEQIAKAKSLGQAGSTGIGLTFCRLAVEAHGGSIWVESDPDAGTTFLFTIPAADESIVSITAPASEELTYSISQTFSDEDKECIHSIARRIVAEDVRIYQYSDLMTILDEYPLSGTPELQRWRQQIEHAIIAGNNELFQELLFISTETGH